MNFVIKMCLPEPAITFVMGACRSVQIRSKMEVVLVRGSQKQKLSSGGWLCHADRTSSTDGFLGNTVNAPCICLTVVKTWCFFSRCLVFAGSRDVCHLGPGHGWSGKLHKHEKNGLPRLCCLCTLWLVVYVGSYWRIFFFISRNAVLVGRACHLFTLRLVKRCWREYSNTCETLWQV